MWGRARRGQVRPFRNRTSVLRELTNSFQITDGFGRYEFFVERRPVGWGAAGVNGAGRFRGGRDFGGGTSRLAVVALWFLQRRDGAADK